MGKQFKIVSADGKYLQYDGNRLSGDVPIHCIDTMDFDDASRIVIEIGDASQLTITEMENGVDLEVYNDTDFMALSGENIQSAVMEMGNGITLSGEDYRFDAYVSTGKIAEDENGLISLSATAAADVSITADGTSVQVESSKDLEDVSTGAYNGAEVSVKDYVDTGAEFTIDEEAKIEGATELRTCAKIKQSRRNYRTGKNQRWRLEMT